MADFRVGVSTLAGPDTFEAPAGAGPPASPLPPMQYLVALNNTPFDDPANITSIAVPAGTVGGRNVWTDLTGFVETCDIVRGRQHELNRFESATCSLSVNNQGGRFNPWNASGPYFSLLKPMKPVQVRARINNQTYYRYTGYVTAVKPIWDDEVGQQKATIECKDAFNLFNQQLLATNQYSAAVIADGATHRWRLNDPVGSIDARDSIRGANGTYFAGFSISPVALGGVGPLLIDSNCGSATTAAPNGASGSSYISTGQLLPAGSGDMTVEFWFNAPAQGSSALPVILAGQNWSGSATTNAWWLQWHPVFQNLQLNVYDNGGVFTNGGIGAGTILPGVWHYVQLAYSGGVFYLNYDGVHPMALGLPMNFSGVLTLGYSPDGTQYQANAAFSELAYYPNITPDPTANYNAGIGIPQNTSGGAILTALVEIGWPTSAINIDTGVQFCQQNTQNLVTTSALTYMQEAEETEAGALFMQGDGKVRFISRDNIALGSQYGQVQAWLADDVQDPSTVGVWGSGAEWDFADGTVGGWLPLPSPGANLAVSTAQAKNDTSSLLLTVTANATNASAYTGTGLPVTVGQSVTLTGYMLSGVNVQSGSMSIDWHGTGGAYLSSTFAATQSLPIGQWVQFTVTGVAPAGALTAAAVSHVPVQNIADTIYTDKVSLISPPGGLWDQSTWGSLSIPFQPGPDMALDETDIVNQAVVTRIGGIAQVANDLVSQNGTGSNDGFGLRSKSAGTVLHLTDTASLAHAQWLVAKLGQPVFRMRTLHVNLIDVLYDTSKVTRLLGLDLLHRVKVNRFQMGFEQTGLIERWEEKISADSWNITIAMSPTDTYQLWGWGGAQ